MSLPFDKDINSTNSRDSCLLPSQRWRRGTFPLNSTDPKLTLTRHTTDASGYQAAANLSEDFAARARREINTDEPSIDGLQAILLLVSAFTATGKGKKAYMLMSKNRYYSQVFRDIC